MIVIMKKNNRALHVATNDHPAKMHRYSLIVLNFINKTNRS